MQSKPLSRNGAKGIGHGVELVDEEIGGLLWENEHAVLYVSTNPSMLKFGRHACRAEHKDKDQSKDMK